MLTIDQHFTELFARDDAPHEYRRAA